MNKKKLAILVLSVLIIFCLYAQTDEKQFQKVKEVLLDCMTASIVSVYSNPYLELPSQFVTRNHDTHLPNKISYFLADPSDFKNTFSRSKNLKIPEKISNYYALLELFSKDSASPLSVINARFIQKDYKSKDYVISGNIVFNVDNQESYDNYSQEWIKNIIDQGKTNLQINVSVSGSRFAEPVNIVGSYNLKFDKNNNLILEENNDSTAILGQTSN